MSLKSLIKPLIPKAILKKRAQILMQISSFKALALQYNQWQSIKLWESIDAQGRAIPWITYPAIEYLSNLDFSTKRILEWGSGNSSLWWANRAKEVISIESNKEWFEKINAKKLPNQRIFLKSSEDFARLGAVGKEIFYEYQKRHFGVSDLKSALGGGATGKKASL